MTSPFPTDQTLMEIRVTVGGQQLKVSQMVYSEALDHPDLKASCEAKLRNQLIDEILKRWKPVIHYQS